MQRLAGIIAFVCIIFTGIPVYALTDVQQTVIVIEKSPFAQVEMEVPNSLSGFDVVEYDTNGFPAHGKELLAIGELVAVIFYAVVEDPDIDRMVAINIGIITPWSQLVIEVDPNVAGMLLSYKRYSQRLASKGAVTLIVPSEEDKQRWIDVAQAYYLEYKNFFLSYQYRILEKEAKRKRVKREKEELRKAQREAIEMLRQNPILVYPK